MSVEFCRQEWLEWVAISYSRGSTQGSNACLLHWQANSFTSEPSGKLLSSSLPKKEKEKSEKMTQGHLMGEMIKETMPRPLSTY